MLFTFAGAACALRMATLHAGTWMCCAVTQVCSSAVWMCHAINLDDALNFPTPFLSCRQGS
eukprot:366033-Chlamydomonas_euryale.AAC.3